MSKLQFCNFFELIERVANLQRISTHLIHTERIIARKLQIWPLISLEFAAIDRENLYIHKEKVQKSRLNIAYALQSFCRMDLKAEFILLSFSCVEEEGSSRGKSCGKRICLLQDLELLCG